MGGSSASNVSGSREDPLGAYNFKVEIEGLLVAGFTQASGLEVTTDVFKYAEGGHNAGEWVFPGKSTFSDITLTHGMTLSTVLYDWYMDVLNGKITRKNATIFLLDKQKETLRSWNLYHAFPSKWVGPSFDAAQGGIAFEALTLVHEGFI